MAEAALKKQVMYAKLLQSQWGYPVYVPMRDIRIGDVARFVGSQYARCFNVFDLSPEMAAQAGLNIETPRFADSEKVVREEEYRIHSVASDQVTMQAIDVGAGVRGAAGEYGIKIKKGRAAQKAAVCLPTEPATKCTVAGLVNLQLWWEQWKHNIAVRYHAVNTSSPIFLVVGMVKTPEFAICCSESYNTETHLKLHGHAPLPTPVPNTFFLKMNAAFSELGNSFGFSMGRYDPTKQPWVVFVDELRVNLWGPFRKMKGTLIRVFDHLRKKQSSRYGSFSSSPGGVSPGSSPRGSYSFPQDYQRGGSSGSSYNLSAAGQVMLDASWTLIKTESDEYFIEHTGKPGDLDYFETGGDYETFIWNQIGTLVDYHDSRSLQEAVAHSSVKSPMHLSPMSSPSTVSPLSSPALSPFPSPPTAGNTSTQSQWTHMQQPWATNSSSAFSRWGM